MSYVDAGYISALGVMFLYGVGLVMRRRRWERARTVAQRDAGAVAEETPTAPVAPGHS
jgi:hypothetical protein